MPIILKKYVFALGSKLLNIMYRHTAKLEKYFKYI